MIDDMIKFSPHIQNNLTMEGIQHYTMRFPNTP